MIQNYSKANVAKLGKHNEYIFICDSVLSETSHATSVLHSTWVWMQSIVLSLLRTWLMEPLHRSCTGDSTIMAAAITSHAFSPAIQEWVKMAACSKMSERVTEKKAGRRPPQWTNTIGWAAARLISCANSTMFSTTRTIFLAKLHPSGSRVQSNGVTSKFMKKLRSFLHDFIEFYDTFKSLGADLIHPETPVL